MTAPTPEQMRLLAARAVPSVDGDTWSSIRSTDLVLINRALRAAADLSDHKRVEGGPDWTEEISTVYRGLSFLSKLDGRQRSELRMALERTFNLSFRQESPA